MTQAIRAATGLVLLVVLCLTHWGAYRQGGAAVQTRFDGYVDNAARVAEARRAENTDRAVVIEERVKVQTVYRDRFITVTVKELEHAAQPLAECPVPDDAVRLLNDAAACARADRPAACGADDAVPDAG